MADYEKNNTITGICNSALALAGHTDFIDDIDDNNPTAATCRMLITQVCHAVQMFEYGAWDELYHDVRLALRGQVPTSNRRYEWNLPFDKLVVVSCYLTPSMQEIEYELHGRYLWCNHDKDVCIKYVKASLDPSEWSSELRETIIQLLSIRLIAALVKDYKTSKTLEDQFWQVEFPRWAACRKNKNLHNDYKGNDNIISRNYLPRGQTFTDRY